MKPKLTKEEKEVTVQFFEKFLQWWIIVPVGVIHELPLHTATKAFSSLCVFKKLNCYKKIGIWLFVKGKEYFLSYKDYPYFKDQTLKAMQRVQLLHGYHLYWPELDVDLEIDNLENPEKYSLKSQIRPL